MSHSKTKHRARKSSQAGAKVSEDKNAATEPSAQTAQHYDVQERAQDANSDVEIAKSSLGDSTQTDNRPRDP